MKRTYKECDACGERAEWGDDHLPTDWGVLKGAPQPPFDLCAGCLAPIRAAVKKRKETR